MKRSSLGVAALPIIFVLAGCTQNKAGIAKADLEWCPTNSGLVLCKVNITDGKERDDVELEFTKKDGTKITYTAKGIRAFEGQALRAAVDKAISADIKAIAPGIVGSVVKAVTGIP